MNKSIIFLFCALSVISIECEIPHEYQLVRIRTKQTEQLDEVFIHGDAWMSIAEFAYIARSDSHDPHVTTLVTTPQDIVAGSIVFVCAEILDAIFC